MRITKEHSENLINHANWLEENVNPEKFDMSNFYVNENDETLNPDEVKHECGTSACVIGWGPSNPNLPKVNNNFYNWDNYADNVFGLSSDSFGRMLFEGDVDNNIHKVAHNMRMAAKLLVNDDDLNESLMDILLDDKSKSVYRQKIADMLEVELYKEEV